jgi:hypothetical protein
VCAQIVMSTPTRTPAPVELAARRLRRLERAGAVAYDDLGVPGWRAFLEARGRFLRSAAGPRTPYRT